MVPHSSPLRFRCASPHCCHRELLSSRPKRGICGAEAEMRIIDVLRQGDGDGDEMDATTERKNSGVDGVHSSATSSYASFTSTSSAASSPRSLLSRWLLPLRKPSPGGGGLGSPRWGRKKKGKKGEREEREGAGLVVSASAPAPAAMTRAEVMTGARPPGWSLRRDSSGAGEEEEGGVGISVPKGLKTGDASFSLGMGAGLILFLARNATEFSKMTEMQRQMETLVKEIKYIVQKKDTVPVFSVSNSSIAFSASDCCDDVNTSKTLSLRNCRTLDREGAAYTGISDGISNYDRSSENRRSPKMDQLEAELEIELEQLQFSLEGEDLAVLPGTYGMEPAEETTGPSEIFSISFGEDDEHNKEHQSEFCGVSARELERRLHELLGTRQQERIAELESALECTKRKLQEKEVEVSWWRETALHATPQRDETLWR